MEDQKSKENLKVKYLRVNFNRKLRNLSWRIRPLFLSIDEYDVLLFVFIACVIGLGGAR